MENNILLDLLDGKNQIEEIKLIQTDLNLLFRECLAECFGTFLLVTFGDAVVAQTLLSNGGSGSSLSINIGWGIAVILSIYSTASISGGHLNPAMTIAFAVHRGFPLKKVFPYILSQLFGAFLAALLVYLNYIQAINHYDNGVRQTISVDSNSTTTAEIFVTSPQPYLSCFSAFFDEFIGTMFLTIFILALTDSRQSTSLPAPAYIPILIGLVVLAIGLCFGLNTGYAINPARDLGPRIFLSMAGWGLDPFRVKTKDGVPYWWVPVLAPCVGSVFGGAIFRICLGAHYPNIDPDFNRLHASSSPSSSPRHSTSSSLSLSSRSLEDEEEIEVRERGRGRGRGNRLPKEDPESLTFESLSPLHSPHTHTHCSMEHHPLPSETDHLNPSPHSPSPSPSFTSSALHATHLNPSFYFHSNSHLPRLHPSHPHPQHHHYRRESPSFPRSASFSAVGWSTGALYLPSQPSPHPPHNHPPT